MKLGSVSLFSRTNSPRSFNIAASHSRHSLTWTWILSVSFDGIWRKPSGWPRIGIHPYRTNGGLQVSIVLPFVVFHWHRQRPMWFRDLFHKARDREEALEERVSLLRRELTIARSTALLSADEARPQ